MKTVLLDVVSALAALFVYDGAVANISDQTKSEIKDCFFEVRGLRVIDGPCRVDIEKAYNLENTFNMQIATFKGRDLFNFVKLRMSPWQTTASWNEGPPNSNADRSLGPLSREINNDCWINNISELCLWVQGQRPVAYKNPSEPFWNSAVKINFSDYIPVYNVDRNCSEKTANNSSLLRRCITNEQEAYDNLKQAWNSIDEITSKICLSNGNDRPWDNYQVIIYCVQSQMSNEIEKQQSEKLDHFHP